MCLGGGNNTEIKSNREEEYSKCTISYRIVVTLNSFFCLKYVMMGVKLSYNAFLTNEKELLTLFTLIPLIDLQPYRIS